MNGNKTLLENKWFAVGIIFLVTCILYLNSLRVPFVFDDYYKIVKNPDITQLSNLKTKLIYSYEYNKSPVRMRNDPSRPLTSLTFTLNYYFGGLDTFGYHLFNLSLHLLNCILILFLTRKALFHIYKINTYFFPSVVALFFAVHPVNAYTVTYIYARSDLLVTFFYMVSVLSFIKTFETNNKKYYFLSISSFLLALASKQTAVTLPAIVLLVDYILLGGFHKEKVLERKYYHITFWILSVVYLATRYIYLGGIGDLEANIKWSRFKYFIIQPYVMFKYFKLMLIPAGYCIDHYLKPVKIFELKALASYLMLAGLFVTAYLAYKRKDNTSKLVALSALWFFITISPTQSFFPTAGPLVENRIYLPGAGFYLMLAFLYFALFNKAGSSAKADKNNITEYKGNKILLILICLHVLILGAATVKRNYVHKDILALWEDAAAKYPDNYGAHNNLGVIYRTQGENLKALREFEKAVELKPDYFVGHDNLAVLYNWAGDYELAIEEYIKANEIDPGYAYVHNNLGILYMQKKEYVKSEQEFRKAVELDDNYAMAHINMGNLYAMLDEYEKAVKEFKKTCEVDPGFSMAHFNLGILYEEHRQYRKALEEFGKYLAGSPDDVKAKEKIRKLKNRLK